MGGTAGAPSDPYFNNISLLLHCDGTDGSTSILDSSLRTKTVTSQNSGVISTTYKKYGTGGVNAFGAYYTSPSNTDFDLLGDFTLEMWVYPTGGSTSQLQGLFNVGQYNTGLLFRYNGNPSTANLDVWLQGNNYVFNLVPLTDATWHFIVLQRSSGILNIYIDGIKNVTNWSSTVTIPAGDVLIGASAHSVSEFFIGYMDEIRLTKGIARYTGDFTPPTVPFPNS